MTEAFRLPGVRPPEDAAMTTRDGTRLISTVWRPEGEGPWPALLMRQPYGRAIASTVTVAHPSWHAARGYVVVVQDVRGTGDSGGRFDAYAYEAADGAEAAEWAAALPGVNGAVGGYGFSYQAATQFLTLASGGRLGAICPSMGPWDQWRHNASIGGALSLGRTVGWAMQIGAIAARHAGDAEAFAAFAQAQKALPVDGAEPALPGIAHRLRRYCHLADWVENAGPGPFWEARSPSSLPTLRPEALTTPALHVGGWFDTFLAGTIEAHAAFRAAGAPTRLVIGPWGHLNWGVRAGADGYGEAAKAVIDRLNAAWLDRFLKGERNGAEEAAPLSLYDLTRREWRDFKDWPDTRQTFFLAGDGLAGPGSTGRLEAEAPADAGAEVFVHDPWRPAPARGGWMAPPDGPAERADLDDRADVAVFQTAPLPAPLRLAGPVEATLAIASPCASLDVVATLSRVRPDGRAATLAQGALRLGRVGREGAAISLRAICATLEPGERLRLSLAGAAFPAIAVNPGDGSRPETTGPMGRGPITIAVTTGGAIPSRVTVATAP